MAASTLRYVTDTSQAKRVIIHSWRNSPDADRVLGPIVDQQKQSSCYCYGITVAEAARAIINLKKNLNIPRLAAMELCNNCSGTFCKRYHASLASEFVRQNGLAEYSRMPLDFNSEPTPGLAEGQHYKIDEWEVLPNYEPVIVTYSVKQPVVVSLYCDPDLFAEYTGGLVDPYLMAQEADTHGHYMLLTGFGYYIFPGRKVKYFWELKNSMGPGFGVGGYMDVIKNSSQPVDKWVLFDPVVPLAFAPGETYVAQHLVEDMSFTQLEIIEKNPNLDIVILFYDGVKDERSLFKDFERVSRFYLPEKEGVKFILVNAEGKLDMVERYLPVGTKVTLPVLKAYKFIDQKQRAQRVRSLRKHGEFVVSSDNVVLDFNSIGRFLISNVGGPIMCGYM